MNQTSLVYRLLALGHTIDEQLNEALEPHGLSLPKYAVLQHLVSVGEPVPLRLIGERLGCVKSNVTQLVDRLEADKLVHRVPDPEDRRSVRAAITDEGRTRYEAGKKSLAEAERDLTSGLDLASAERLGGLLQRLGDKGSG